MLRTRLITGVILAVSFLAVLLHPNSSWFYAFCGVALLVAAWEWAGLCYPKRAFRVLFVAVLLPLLGFGLQAGLAAVAGGMLEQPPLANNGLLSILLSSLPLWLCFAIAVWRFPSMQSLWDIAWLKSLVGLVLFVQAWAALIVLREQANASLWIVFIIALVAFSDIGAYFAGKRFGRHKLAVAVSPGKTWEGFVGGLLASTTLAVVAFFTLRTQLFAEASFSELLPLAVLISALSVIGDLSMSMLKRVAGVKDSGNILPGHGGVLDRIDGMLSAVPVFACLFLLLAW